MKLKKLKPTQKKKQNLPKKMKNWNIEDMSEEDLKSFIEDVINDMIETGELEPGEEHEEEEDPEGEEIDIENIEDEEQSEEVDLDEILGFGKKILNLL